MSDDTTQPFAKTICSICHEHLKPIVENLQAISICGHVFHELCIQQWFEYCSKEKKKCPICKQTCSAANVSRLYFQSPSDSNDPNLSQILQPHKEDPDELKLKVRRLEGKINVLNSALECRDNDLENIRNELSVCKDQLKKEASLKNEALEQTRTIDGLHKSKTWELEQSELKCTKLQKMNLRLAEELVALKLVSDLDLKEHEIGKLASLGSPSHRNNSAEDILKKSLVERNNLFKKLLGRYKALSVKEFRSGKELEKAKEQLKELKKEMQKLETDKKVEDNEVLRAQKASKKTKYPPSLLNRVDPTINDTCIPQDTIKERDINLGKRKRSRIYENINDSVPQPTKSATTDASNLPKNVHETSEHNGVPWNDCKEASSPVPNPQEGMVADLCFPNGLLDGTNRQPSKWCKMGQSKAASGDLIAVGPDGRGGRLKVLKSLNLSSHKAGGSLNSAKKGKIRAKASSLQSQGLQLEHFYSKAGQ